jgi:hypothetical protein
MRQTASSQKIQNIGLIEVSNLRIVTSVQPRGCVRCGRLLRLILIGAPAEERSMRLCRGLASIMQRVMPSPPECSSSESEHENLAVGNRSSSDYLEPGTVDAWLGSRKEAMRGTPTAPSVGGTGHLSAVSDELDGAEGANVPLPLAVLIGCLPLVVVYISFVQQRSAWGAVFSVEAVFALVPLLVLRVWPAPRAHVLSALRRQPCGLMTQLWVGLAVGMGSFVCAAAIFEL